MGNMGMAAMEAAEKEANWRKMAIEEWGHSETCNIFNVGGMCNCDKPNLKKQEKENDERYGRI